MAKRKKRKEWPSWWHWELEVLDHVFKRMGRREFTEIDLRRMMEHATGYHPDVVEGRWVIETRHESKSWEVIVEPVEEIKRLVVVTAYDVWES